MSSIKIHALGKVHSNKVPDSDIQVLDNTVPFLHSSSVSFWIKLRLQEHQYHFFRQYWFTRNVPVFTNLGTFQFIWDLKYTFSYIFKAKLGMFSQEVGF